MGTVELLTLDGVNYLRVSDVIQMLAAAPDERKDIHRNLRDLLLVESASATADRMAMH